jgi:hypothetical protein
VDSSWLFLLVAVLHLLRPRGVYFWFWQCFVVLCPGSLVALCVPVCLCPLYPISYDITHATGCKHPRLSFYEEMERVFDKFPKYHMKILLGDFNAKVGKDDIFKPTIGN